MDRAVDWLRIALTIVIAAVLAALATGTGLDRMSAIGDIPASAVPVPFRANADRIEADRLFAAGDYPGAIASARLAIARLPTTARAVSVFGMASLLQGDQATAARAFAVSRKLGWRDDFTNVYWAHDALSRGKFEEAADHADALLRQTPGYPQRNLLLVQFDADPAGRTALATRLARLPDWASVYFQDAASTTAGDPSARADVAALLARGHGVRDCPLVSPIISAQLRYGYVPAARAIYRLHCAMPDEAAIPADGFFRRADAARQPTALDWRFSGEGAIGIAFAPRPGWRGRAAIVDNLAPVAMAFAAQPLSLAPGVHRLSWRAVDETGAPSPAVDVAVACDSEAHPWVGKHLADPRTSRFTSAVTVGPECPRQWLTLGIAAGASHIAVGEVTLD